MLILDYSLILFEIFLELEVMAFIKSISIKKHARKIYIRYLLFFFLFRERKAREKQPT